MAGLTIKMSAVWMVALMALLLVPMKGTVAQIPACAMKLAACASFLNATRPPTSCCNPLKDALTNDFPCLCNLYNNPELLINFGINVSDIVTLPARCKLHNDITACSKVLAPSPAPASTAPTALPSPPPVAPKSQGNSLIAISWTATCSMLLFLISVVLN